MTIDTEKVAVLIECVTQAIDDKSIDVVLMLVGPADKNGIREVAAGTTMDLEVAASMMEQQVERLRAKLQ